MSASPVARQAVSHAQDSTEKSLGTKPQPIPKRVIINSPSDLPNDYSTTPGGTLFSTTPGGTRIIYERAFLLNLRNSPLAKSPLKNLPVIPGVTTKDTGDSSMDTKTILEEPEKTAGYLLS
ncbi:Eukaryotic translation initiation factor 4E-binding protein 2 [Armadillidium nasatum]|uniref:Eukaryotic translation initiation factor 4E-binding protein 2 n=1 Tax=Armadillidium nasatum TaxID=96803 RepID=A0A5N5T5V7_9CRUS|nr:Eukaryotic translation initiation factor 4E-binding protein 2 [Armadillidium nasatum]